MCESTNDDEPTHYCPDFEGFPCPGDEDDDTALTGSEALDELSAYGQMTWRHTLGDWTFEYKASEGKVVWDGDTYSVTRDNANARLTASTGDKWMLLKRSDGVFRIGNDKCCVRFQPASGSGKCRTMDAA